MVFVLAFPSHKPNMAPVKNIWSCLIDAFLTHVYSLTGTISRAFVTFSSSGVKYCWLQPSKLDVVSGTYHLSFQAIVACWTPQVTPHLSEPTRETPHKSFGSFYSIMLRQWLIGFIHILVCAACRLLNIIFHRQKINPMEARPSCASRVIVLVHQVPLLVYNTRYGISKAIGSDELRDRFGRR